MKILKPTSIVLLVSASVLFSTPATCGMLTNTPDEIPIANPDPKQEAEEILHCNTELLINYGLKGYGEPTITNHRYCPAIVQNCCTDHDEEVSNAIWTADIQPVVER